ncbi:MAG: glycoside hydrolase family 4 [Kiritimatiellaeota bacterium]|nr:glycoside hydrolase family 4 [Kiritimatiellota bacterium]
MHGPKITVIGAGSYFFGRPIIKLMATSQVMAGGTLALVDTDKRVLGTMMHMAERVFQKNHSQVKLLGATDRKKVMAGSDFIVLTFGIKTAYYRGIETEIAAKYGIRQPSGQTNGPSGVITALRNVPHAIMVARDALKLAPHAWIINLVNPTDVLGLALGRYVPEMRSFALCDGHREPENTLTWLKVAGILPESVMSIPPDVYNKLDLRIGGVNHCCWMVRFTYDGQDMLPTVNRWVVKMQKNQPNADYGFVQQLFELYGALPTIISHTKEYVPFFQGNGVNPVIPHPLDIFNAKARTQAMAESWRLNEEYAAGKRSVRYFLNHTGSEITNDVMESMWGQMGRCYYINTANRGAVTNMPYDAYLELRCDIDLHGPRPHPFGPMPRGILALQNEVLDAHELAAEAAVSGDKAVLRRAMLADPICNNIADADAYIAELLNAEKDDLPKNWFKGGK